MKKITIVTPANIEIEYRLAGVGSRLAAFLVDFFLQILIIAVVNWVIYQTVINPDGVIIGFAIVFSFVIYVGYFIACELFMNGQSVGKKILKLRVICDNGQPVGFTQVLVRGLIRSSVDMLYIGLFTILFSKQSKRLGDMAAGTVVVIEGVINSGGIFNENFGN